MTSKNSSLATTHPHQNEVRVGRLDTISDVRQELSRLYRAARKAAGPSPDASTAAKLAYLLTHIGRSLEASELEKRIANLEARGL